MKKSNRAFGVAKSDPVGVILGRYVQRLHTMRDKNGKPLDHATVGRILADAVGHTSVESTLAAFSAKRRRQ